MFRDFNACKKIDIEYLDTSNVGSFDTMFYYDSALIELKTSQEFVTSKANNLRYMFYCCTKLKSIDTSNWDVINVTTMFGTFRMCQSITSYDLSNWDTSKVTRMDYLFQYNGKCKTIYVSEKWNTDKVTDSGAMFQGCNVLEGQIKWNSSNAQDKTYANYETGYFTYKEPAN